MMTPTIDGGPVMAMFRGGADAAVLSTFGALLFPAWFAPARAGRGPPIAWISFALALALTAGWTLLETVAIGGSLGALDDVLRSTLFGHVVLTRLALLTLAATAAARWRWTSALLAGLAVVTLAGHGHALAMTQGPSWLLLSGTLHLLAAGVWLGQLLPLLVFVAGAGIDDAAAAARRFSPWGAACVAVLASTALVQSSILIGSVPGLIGTAYGLVALLKLALFLALLGFAARHRFWLTPALGGARPASARRLARSVGGEAAVGLLVVLAAGLLTSLEPSMHAQPVWPFAWRLSLEAVSLDPEFLREVVLAAVGIAVASAAALAAFIWRWRLRWLLLPFAAVATTVSMPHLDLLLAEADPTYFWISPTGFSSASIAAGAALYPQHCAVCHGPDGRGDGPAAAWLPVPPADLAADHLGMHTDGELFWWLSHGIAAPDGSPAMPAFAGALTEDQRWALIDVLRAKNAGSARKAGGAWPVPTLAPNLQLTCADRTTDLHALRGQVVRVAFPLAGAPADSGQCAAVGLDARRAYAIVTGVGEDALSGSEIIVDAAGWLRAVRSSRADPQALAGEIADIAAHPLAAPSHAAMRM